MPIYKFKCKECGKEYEDFRSVVEKEERGACIQCGSASIERLENMTEECACGCGCSGPGAEHGHG
ncbi:MAG: FmdB family zinc ribbon protein [bacterium]